MQFVLLILGFILMVVGLSVLLTYPTMLLWNWLMPFIFDLPTLTFWQTFGLMILTSLLFKNTNSSSSK